MAQPFNLSTLALEGEAAVIAADVAPGCLRGVGQFSASNGGVLAFVKTRGGSAGQLTWFDRTGRALTSIPQAPGAENLNPAISPNGTQVAVNLMDPQTGNWDIWVVDVARGVFVERFMASGVKKQVSHGGGVHPRWTRDGRELVFWAQPGGVMSVALDFSGEGLTIVEPKVVIATPVFSLIDARPHYDVTREGERFLLRQPTTQRAGAVTIMINWADKLKR